MREIREEVRRVVREVRKEIREAAREQEEGLKRELEKIKKEWAEREEKWKEERREISEKIREMEGKLKVLQIGKEKRKQGVKGGGERGWREGRGREELRGMKERIRALEWDKERGEREKRGKKIVIKGIKGVKEQRDLERKVRQVIGVLGVDVKIGEMKRVEAGKRKWGEMVVVEVGSEEERRKVMESKRKLRLSGEKEVWIEKDLTWKEERLDGS